MPFVYVAIAQSGFYAYRQAGGFGGSYGGGAGQGFNPFDGFGGQGGVEFDLGNIFSDIFSWLIDHTWPAHLRRKRYGTHHMRYAQYRLLAFLLSHPELHWPHSPGISLR